MCFWSEKPASHTLCPDRRDDEVTMDVSDAAEDKYPADGEGASTPTPVAETAADPVLSVPPQILARYNARVLDAATAWKVAGRPRLRPTVYLADRLLAAPSASPGFPPPPPPAHRPRR